jgi:hypothetical protein
MKRLRKARISGSRICKRRELLRGSSSESEREVARKVARADDEGVDDGEGFKYLPPVLVPRGVRKWKDGIF